MKNTFFFFCNEGCLKLGTSEHVYPTFVFIEVECGILIDRICFVSYWLRVVSLFKVVMSNWAHDKLFFKVLKKKKKDWVNYKYMKALF